MHAVRHHRPMRLGARAGGEYLGLLDKIHAYLLPRTYLEVGIRYGTSIALTLPGTVAVGVDPAYEIRFPLDASTRLFKMTSEEFYQREDLAEIFGGLPVDLAFIDGMHRFGVALHDFMNVERLSAPGSVVLLHDCNPKDERWVGPDPLMSLWTGDVWKVIPCLREHRPDLDVHTIDVGPSGLGIIAGLDPESRVLEERYEDICRQYYPWDYTALDRDEGRVGLLGLVPPDWAAVRELLPSRPFRDGDASRLRLARSLRRPTMASTKHALHQSVKRSRFGRPARRLRQIVQSEGRRSG
jgi:Methyltransferase domain